MNISKITPNKIVESALKPIIKKTVQNPPRPQMSAARANIEMFAEHMNPQDYIRMKSYIAELEMEKFIENSIL